MRDKLAIFFRAVADRGNITAASHDLHLTQSAVSKVIRQLEHEYGASLVERRPRGIALTELGEVLYAHARKVAVSEGDARAHIQAMLNGRVHLRIGAGALWALSSLPQAFMALKDTYPECQADLVVGTRELLLPQLVSGELDIAISQDSEFEHPDVDRYFLDYVPIRAACRRSHPLHQLAQPSAADLLGYSWINYQSARVDAADRDENKPRSIYPGANYSISASSWILCIQLVSQSDLVMGIPDRLLPLARTQDVLPLANCKLITTLEGYLWVRKARSGLPIVKELVAQIIKTRNLDTHADQRAGTAA
jgi:DNA-binding transcriptional LysR family regulator